MVHKNRLFLASCLALTVTAMMFVIRGDIAAEVEGLYQIDHKAYGWVSALAFLGFATSIFVASPLLDALGMRNLLLLAFVLHIGGLLAFIFAPNYTVLSYSMLFAGFGNGLVEAVINPLCACTYPDDKTHKMNVLHAWWPGGLIIGGLLAEFMDLFAISWQIKMGIVIIPTIVYGYLVFHEEFPQTERAEAGVPWNEMVMEAFRPGFLLLLMCMMVTASMELAPNQWVDSLLKETANTPGTLILVYGSGLMFVLRFFAGPIAKMISPIGIMWASVTVAGIGLWMLSLATTAMVAYAAATVFYVGVCFMWPTMLGIAAERYPRGGAVTIGMMGFAGQVMLGLLIFRMGAVFDELGPVASLQTVAKLGIFVFFAFGAWWIRDYMMGGYKAIKLVNHNDDGAGE